MRKALHILGILDDRDVEWISNHGHVRHINAGAVLIREKQPIDAIYILLEGELVVRVGEQESRLLARLRPGEIVGEISFVDSRPPSASVIAGSDSLVLALPRDRVEAKLRTDLAFAGRFYRALACFLADRLYVTVGRLGYGSPEQDRDLDEVADSTMEELSMASNRFDKLLRQLRGDYRTRSAISA
jgi:CRP-like cAMP-binding protein